jgi:maltooligosyltrehalose trehalohydrolase
MPVEDNIPEPKSNYFSVWAPDKEAMTLHIVAPFEKEFEMEKDEWGYFSVHVNPAECEICYYFKPENHKDYPDPRSQYQPEGVHGPSQTVDHKKFEWHDDRWKNFSLAEYVIYEIHVGTFTYHGTFEAIIPRLDDLKETGINAIELMPVAQFPGARNWGYDGVYPYAVQNSYGGPVGLKKLVDACHARGIAVILDVVYNHLGPEGNYLSNFGPYFTNRYNTPWGEAINFDGDWSDGVREYFSENIIYWMEQYHVDALRCDAIHAIYDNGAIHFWELASNKVRDLENKTGRCYYLIAESDLNSPRVVKSPGQGGFGFSAQWLDDFHHALYKMVNKEDKDRYYDFGSINHLAKAYVEGFVHSGEWVRFRKRKYGASSAGIPGDRFIAFNLNHDQAGNRAAGERLSMLVDFERQKVAAAALLLSPYIPLLFMGEEYGDDTPFYYFVSHSDEELIKAVQKGRKEEFKTFGFDDSVPDPQAEKTFHDSIIRWDKRNTGHYRIIRLWHQHLLTMRRNIEPLKTFDKKNLSTEIINEHALILRRFDAHHEESLMSIFNFADQPVEYTIPGTHMSYASILDSKDSCWMQDKNIANSHPLQVMSGQTVAVMPLSVVVYQH